MSINEGLFSKASAPRLFLEDGNIFRKSASVVQWGIAVEFVPRRPIFENVLLFEKKGRADFSPGLYGGLYGQNLPHKFKNSYGDFQNRNFEKSHTKFLVELLVPDQI